MGPVSQINKTAKRLACRAKALVLVGLGACLVFVTSLRAQTLYWDTNGTAAGAGGASPSGTWASSGGGNKNWGNAAGTSRTNFWSYGSNAVFSAGTDATGSFTVTVSGTQTVGNISVEEGNPTISNGTLAFNAASPTFDVASGSTATVGSDLTGASTSFTKSGAGTLVLSGANTWSGTTNIDGGTLQLASSNALPNGTNLVLGGGTLSLAGFSSTLGSLSVTADSVIDFGTAAASVLTIGSLSISSGITLTIQNWTDAVDYFYSLADPGNTNLSRIVFSNYPTSSVGWLSWDSQIVPVPEPATYGALLVAVSALLAGFLRYRRRAL